MNKWSYFFIIVFKSLHRLATNNNTSKSESDQEDNDDLNDNDWSYGAEKKGECVKCLFIWLNALRKTAG